MALTPQVIDVPLTVMDQTPPAHAGPIGRIQTLKDGEVVHYLPPQPGGAGGGASPQVISIQQREAFVSLSSEMRDVTNGNQIFDTLPSGELLDTLGDQLVNVSHSVPRVWNGATWSQYSGTRVLAGKLEQDILHTSNRTIQASDSATIGGVTCFVWTETVSGLTTSFVGFKSSDGAWIVQPQTLYAMTITSDIALAKVVSDGTRFWVVFNKANSVSPNIGVQVYDTHGALVASAGKIRNWLTSPGFWDIVVQPGGAAVILAQPASYSPATDVHVEFTRFTISGAVISQSSHTDTSIKCIGPVTWATNDGVVASSFSYLITQSLFEGAPWILAYEINTTTMTQAHEYQVAVLTEVVDSFNGYLFSSSGVGVVVAVSVISNFTPSAGPPNDPALRNVQVYSCTRAGVTALIKRAPGVCLQSRAFSISTSPAAAPDYYAVTYYQSGGGLLASQRVITLAHDAADNMTGDAVQKLDVREFDEATGAPHLIPTAGGTIIPTNAMGSITHNAGDSATAATQTWVFNNATFRGTTTDSLITAGTVQYGVLNVSGSAVTNNNQSYLILKVVNTHTIITQLVGSAGHAMQDDTLAGVTATVSSRLVLTVPRDYNGNGDVVPPELINQFAPGGTLTIAGSTAGVNDGTFTMTRLFLGAQALDAQAAVAPFDIVSIIVMTPSGSPLLEFSNSSWVMTISPALPYFWIFQNETFDATADGGSLVVSGATEPGNNGTFPINTHVSNAVQTTGVSALRPEVFKGTAIPTIEIKLTGSSLLFTFNAATLDDSYIGGFLIISGAAHAANNDTYIIRSRPATHQLQCESATGTTGHRSEVFGGGVTAKVVLLADPSPAFQPCWFLTPLSVAQQIAGRFEYGVAYADWRFDGATVSSPNVGVDFARNNYPYALSSVPAIGASRSVVLPYRAQSFTAGQVVRIDPNGFGLIAVSESTVGLKRFSLPAGAFGQSAVNSGEMFIPGPMAGSFTASGFHEDGISLAFEAPFYVSQATDATVIGLTRAATYEYVVVAEAMDENGDRTFAIVSPALEVVLTGANNVISIGGRLIGPTNRPLISIAIYRTAIQGGTPTVQHYKITNDLDVNGAGFSFSHVAGGPNDTWTFRDTIQDAAILSQELLYTDRGFTPRFAPPAFSQGVGSWCNRSWLIGYDGAIWMSGEKTEGDAVWFTPAFRFVLPTDDKPVALAPLDEYLLVFCSKSIWFIPKTDFPAANLQSGSLPTPVQLPFQNGCTGWAITIRAGVAYASTAGGVWLITRQLTNVWLSQPVQDDMDGATVTNLRVDEKQRLFVLVSGLSMFMFDQVSGVWAIWRTANSSVLGAVLGGLMTYQDSGNISGVSSISQHTPNVFLDNIPTALAGPTFPIILDVQLAAVNMAGVRTYKRCWAIQIVGQYQGPHNLNVVVTYPDDDMAPTTYPPFTPAADEAYVYEVNPNPEEAATFSVRIFTDFNGVLTPGNSLVLEMLSFEVGLERGIGPLPAAKRIPAAG